MSVHDNSKAVALPFKPKLLQAIRLLHAIAECGYPVALDHDDLATFAPLTRHFQRVFVDRRSTQYVTLNDVAVDHATPTTTVGPITRPLFLPWDYARYCRRLWSHSRPVRFGFCGNLSNQRLSHLLEWGSMQFGSTPRVPFRMVAATLAARLMTRVGTPLPAYTHMLGPLQIVSSMRGRLPRYKALDSRYLSSIADTQFTLCPNGDFVWTYRFFEAALCGSIPIVQSPCPHYEGFRYHSMSDPASALSWSQDIAEHNYALCVRRLCIPIDDLSNALSSIVARPRE